MRVWLYLLVASLAFGAFACGPAAGNEDFWIDDAGRYHYLDGGPTHCVPSNPVDCDLDGDGYTPNQGDCDDNDPTVHPGADECNAAGNGDGRDNNCNQYFDEGCLDTDADGDGYTRAQGDCDDADISVNPAAYEVPGNNKDDNCDGRTDEETKCDCGGSLNPQDVQSYINALELCDTPQIQNPALNGNALSRAILPSFGNYVPRASNSCNLVILSTGPAGSKDPQEDRFASDLGVDYAPNPARYPENPGYSYEPTEVYDYTEIRMSLLVPTNAKSFSFDFVFLTSEYPEWSCTEYNDTFIAWLTSQQFTGNISFDGSGNTIQVNSAFFGADPAELAGTGYDAISYSCDSIGGRTGCTMPSVGSTCTVGGTTGWLTTTSPVTPGEMIDLNFSIFDEGDHVLDSMVIIDNFRWEVTGSAGPCTDPDGC
jgi:hypothetical protein